MKKINLIPLICIATLLSGCASVLETTASWSEETPANAPKGYHSYRNGQKYLQQGNLSMATLNFCNAAELGHPEAPKECAKYKVIEEAVYINDNVKSISTNYLAQRSKNHICEVSKYGNPAKSLCDSIQNTNEKDTLLAVLNKASGILDSDNKKQLEQSIKKGSTSSGLKVEDF